MSDGAAEELPVAAPPWAAKAMSRLAEALPDIALRHVPVDPESPKTGGIPAIRVLWRYHMTAVQLTAALEQLPDLEWVHSDYVGVDDLPLADMARRGLLLSNGAGISAGPMAEWVVLAVLAAAKQLPRFVRQSDAGVWEVGPPLAELRDAVVLLLGLGAVGARVAELLAPFGTEVRASARTPRATPPAGVAKMVGPAEWQAELADADFVVSTLPLTAQTAGALDAAAFAAMRRGAWLVNVSRGGVVDEAALVAALDDGHLGGAVLDAFAEEPLPAGNPLWKRPDVLVLPHVTWSTSHTLDDFVDRFAAQLRRFAGGDAPADIVDLDAGY
ncbi:MAG: D-2-hydroxyacid dehydrogenase [Acidimicrobiales bacterium]